MDGVVGVMVCRDTYIRIHMVYDTLTRWSFLKNRKGLVRFCRVDGVAVRTEVLTWSCWTVGLLLVVLGWGRGRGRGGTN